VIAGALLTVRLGHVSEKVAQPRAGVVSREVAAEGVRLLQQFLQGVLHPELLAQEPPGDHRAVGHMMGRFAGGRGYALQEVVVAGYHRVRLRRIEAVYDGALPTEAVSPGGGWRRMRSMPLLVSLPEHPSERADGDEQNSGGQRRRERAFALRILTILA
jgi:hypothetical protein